ELYEKIKAAKSANDLLASLGTPKSAEQETMEKSAMGASLGDHATMNLKDALTRIKAQRSGTTASAVEFPLSGVKAAGDPHQVLTTGNGLMWQEMGRDSGLE